MNHRPSNWIYDEDRSVSQRKNADRSTFKLLYADGQKSDQEWLLLLSDELGLATSFAGSGQDVLSTLRIQAFDLLMVGGNLCDVNSLDLIRLVKEDKTVYRPDRYAVLYRGAFDKGLLDGEAARDVQFETKPLYLSTLRMILFGAAGETAVAAN